MKKTHTILVPSMLPIHFEMITAVFRYHGYNCELLKTSGRSIIDEGLKNVHNDTCYPALLVIGQFMDALKSGKYNPDTTALLLPQSGGGCRASNYISLMRKALRTQFPQVPVISLNFSGLEKASSLQINMKMFFMLMECVNYSDLIMSLYNQCKPYELTPGKSDAVKDKWTRRLSTDFQNDNKRNKNRIYHSILHDFSQIERRKEHKIKVGVVGEIFVKYSSLANNGLEEFLLSEGCEPYIPMLSEFILYATYAGTINAKLYGNKTKSTFMHTIGYNYLKSQQKVFIKAVKKYSQFEPPHDFDLIIDAAKRLINIGVTMGEGWLIPAEMAVFCQTGVNNIICVQPFGCLPNHIVGKGKLRAIKEAYPKANIVAVDYDPGATKVNQENRIKLMLSNAQ
jgi:predicted nucleotide-binding protein (sugar kinase/HSP70/actin superfamily)